MTLRFERDASLTAKAVAISSRRSALHHLAALRTGAPFADHVEGVPLGVDGEERLEAWVASDDLGTVTAWIAESGEVMVLEGDAVLDWTQQGGFVDGASRLVGATHVCVGAECAGCAIDAA
ncbi:MAG: hypothetical protein J0L92_08510 [Deltaproteobacteria bacterium]|nr:hypothetical protein [Deltaproteobacteria bacterium]